MTHEYTLLLGGRIVRGDGGPDATALAWATGTVLALGTDEEILAISRGDSAVVALHGLTLAPAPGSVLEVGAPAELSLLDLDCPWTYRGEEAQTLGVNSPWEGQSFAVRPAGMVNGNYLALRG